MEREEIKEQLKIHMIEYLNLIDYTPDTIKDNEMLFGEGLGLDSIDSLELAVLLEREFGVKVKDSAEGRKVFASVNTMTDFIIENRKL